MKVEFPATRWSAIARLPGHPKEVAGLLGLYSDAIGAYLQAKLPNENADRREDVIQEVLLDLLSKPEVLAKAQPGNGGRFRYYLMHIAWQSALSHLRYHRQRDHRSIHAPKDDGVSLEDDLVSTEPGPEQHSAMDRAWALSVIQQSLDEASAAVGAGRLDAEALTILRGNLIEGRGLRELATAYGLSLATCSRRLAQGRQFLQTAITERLRLAGELGADESAADAGSRLLELLSIDETSI